MTVSGWTLEYRSFSLKFLFLTLPVSSQLCSAKQRHLIAQALGTGRPYVGPSSPPLLYPHYLRCGPIAPYAKGHEVYFPTLVLGWPCGLALTRIARWNWLWPEYQGETLPKHKPKRPWHISTLFGNCLPENKGEGRCSSLGYPIAAYSQPTPKYWESQGQLSKDIYMKYTNPSLDHQTTTHKTWKTERKKNQKTCCFKPPSLGSFVTQQ